MTAPLRIVSLVALSALFAGCSSVELSDEARQAIRTVSIEDIQVAHASYKGHMPELDVRSRGQFWYALWVTAPIGVLVDLYDWPAHNRRRADAFQHALERAGVSVDKIVREEFATAVVNEGPFAQLLNWGADAKFQLALSYGLDDAMGTRGTWKPYVELEGTLVDQDGNVLWRQTANVTDGDERTTELERPLSDGARLARAYRQAARLVASDLMDHLAGKE